MRIIPLLTACLVTAFLYLLIIERDMLFSFARGEAETTTMASQDSTATQDPGPAQSDAIGVVAMHSDAQEIDSAVVLRGQTEAARQVEVRAETSGLVMSEPLRKGTFVEAGQLLCRLDPGTRAASLAEARARLEEARARMPEAEARIPTAEAQLETAKAQLEEARINDNAARKLSEGGFASESRVAGAQAAIRGAEAAVKSAEAGVKTAQSGLMTVAAGIQSAEAAVAAAEKEMSRLEIHAPFAGLLESDTAELGSLISPGSLCATVIQLDPIRVVGFVPETQIDRVEVGAQAGARLADGHEVTGRVTFLSRAADPLTRTFRVELQVPNPDLAIRDGQTAEIAIASDGASAHLVPQSALTLSDDGRLGVRIVDDQNHALFRPVALLRDTAQGVWITGLDDRADVIVIGQEYVVDGVPVRPSYEDQTQ